MKARAACVAVTLLLALCGCSETTDPTGDNGTQRESPHEATSESVGGPRRSRPNERPWTPPEKPPSPEEQFNAQVEYMFRELESEDETVREQALKSFVELGQRVIPHLCDRLGDDKVAKPAREALIQIGVPALPKLAEAIDDPYDYKQHNAVTAILNIDNNITRPETLKATAWAIEEHLRRHPNYYHHGVDVLFSKALKNVQNPAVFPVLLAGLQDDRMYKPENFSLAEYITDAMLRLGPETARPHLDALVEIHNRIKDQDEIHEKTRAAVAKLVEAAMP